MSDHDNERQAFEKRYDTEFTPGYAYPCQHRLDEWAKWQARAAAVKPVQDEIGDSSNRKAEDAITDSVFAPSPVASTGNAEGPKLRKFHGGNYQIRCHDCQQLQNWCDKRQPWCSACVDKHNAAIASPSSPLPLAQQIMALGWGLTGRQAEHIAGLCASSPLSEERAVEIMLSVWPKSARAHMSQIVHTAYRAIAPHLSDTSAEKARGLVEALKRARGWIMDKNVMADIDKALAAFEKGM